MFSDLLFEPRALPVQLPSASTPLAVSVQSHSGLQLQNCADIQHQAATADGESPDLKYLKYPHSCQTEDIPCIIYGYSLIQQAAAF